MTDGLTLDDVKHEHINDMIRQALTHIRSIKADPITRSSASIAVINLESALRMLNPYTGPERRNSHGTQITG